MEQNKITLVDTSSWIESFRPKGRSDVRERVRSLLLDDLAAWCDMVAVELWNGVQGDYEKKKLAELEKEILCLPTSSEVWQGARKLAQNCRSSVLRVPPADLIIASCALFHEVDIEHCDAHFDFIFKAHKN